MVDNYYGNNHRIRIAMLSKGGPPVELPPLFSRRVQAESLLMMHPGKHRVKDSVDQLLHHS